jgi:hypothetical protein
MRRIEDWHHGSVKSYRILYQDADGLGGEVKWDGDNAEVIKAAAPGVADLTG